MTGVQTCALPICFPVTIAAPGNSNYGWFGGGYNPSLPVLKSTVDRIDFSNDSATASPRGRLSSSPGVVYPTATSNTPIG